MINKIFLLLFLLLCNSCKHTPLDGKVETHKISYSLLDLKNNIIGSAENIHIVDSFLVILDSKSDFIFHIINLNNMEWKDFGIIGHGPNEFIHPFHFHYKGSNNLCIWDLMKCSLTELHLKEIYNNEDNKQIDLLTSQTENSNISILPTIYNTYITLGIYKEGMFKLINREGELINSFFEYPYKDDEEKNIPTQNRALAYQGSIMTNPSLTKFCFACMDAPIINFYSITNDSIKLINSIIDGYANYKPINNSSAMMPDNKTAFACIYATENYVYALYSGRTRSEYKNTAFESQEIRVYDWSGKQVKKFLTDIPLSLICVTHDDKYIYAIADNPNPEILKFNIFNQQGLSNKIQSI